MESYQVDPARNVGESIARARAPEKLAVDTHSANFYKMKGNLMDLSLQVTFAKWRGLNQFHWALVLCLVILGWIVDPSLADPVAGLEFSQLETRTLRLGQERIGEKLPFRSGGRCVYELMDMKQAHWYEVKISYPASTPAVFSIDLVPEHDDPTLVGRKLLNTEKIIIHLPKGLASQDVQVGMKRQVVVSVKPEGFVAQPYVHEQAFILYNILLEEVVLGIPLQAFWVGFLGLVAICAAVLASRLLVTRLQPLQQELANKSS